MIFVACTHIVHQVGPQQQAYNFNGEVTFSCIAYWLADAFSGGGRKAWKYEYRIPPAFHAADLFGNGWLFDPTQNIPEAFALRFRGMLPRAHHALLDHQPGIVFAVADVVSYRILGQFHHR